MILAFSYVRFSTRNQAQGVSVERQLEAGKKYCDENGLTLSDDNFSDLGISAYKNEKRDGFDEMLAAIDSGRIPKGSYVLIEAIDRLSRKGIEDTNEILRKILKSGVNIAFVGDDAKTLSGTVLTEVSLSDLGSVISVSLAADLAYKESLRKAKLIKDAKARAREEAKKGTALPKHLPFWLKYDKEDKQYVFKSADDEKLIKEIVELKQQGIGTRQIAKRLNERGVLSPHKRGWSHTTIRKVISSPALCGDYEAHQHIEGKAVFDCLIKDYFPPVINRDEWSLLQSDKNMSSKGRTAKDNPFSGVLRCFYCHSGMIYSRKEGKAKDGTTLVYEYHYCSDSTLGKCIQKKRVRNLIPFLKTVMDKIKISKKKIGNTTSLKNEINRKQDKLDDVSKILKESSAKIESMRAVVDIISELQTEVDELNRRLSEEISDSINLSTVDLTALSSVTDSNEYNMYIKRVIKAIYIKYNTKTNYSVHVKKRDGETQDFSCLKGKMGVYCDSAETKELLNKYAQEYERDNAYDGTESPDDLPEVKY